MKVNEILSLAKHSLHLCNSSNINEIVFSSLIDADVFITNHTEAWNRIFDENEIKCKIKKPEETAKGERIVVDGSSLNDFEKWERKWKLQNKAVCIYNIDKVKTVMLKPLIDIHDKMVLSVNNVKMLSDKTLEKELDNLSPEIVENIVKRELRNVVLSLLLSKPMSGTDLVKLLYQKFRVFISPGMLYPTLHELEKTGLLKYEYKLKNKVYSVLEEDQTKLLLNKHVKVNSMLSDFLAHD